MEQLIIIIVALQLASIGILALLFYWIRGVQERHDLMLAAIQAELAARENRLLMIASRLERVFRLRGMS